MSPGNISGFTQFEPLQKIGRPLISNVIGGVLRLLVKSLGSSHVCRYMTISTASCFQRELCERMIGTQFVTQFGVPQMHRGASLKVSLIPNSERDQSRMPVPAIAYRRFATLICLRSIHWLRLRLGCRKN